MLLLILTIIVIKVCVFFLVISVVDNNSMMAPTPGAYEDNTGSVGTTPRFVINTPSQETSTGSKSQCSSMSDGESYECDMDVEAASNGQG